ncbi:MAG: FKBP-type peptidyl-prolyl cis-trans isomerase [Prolixibacteraceae bacterium]|jgi:FKBP-type peptidyl-prolyl cis-trans isomerase|nr:FKBP-type peptidyl-prolyl cis-trans isomerase [Prolixibacteraceae bacterium]
MKIRKILNLLLPAVLLVASVSCGKEEEEEITYSAEKEQELLQEYLDYLIGEDYDIDTTANGVFYVTLEEGTGNMPRLGDKVSVSYDGFFIGGSVFDSSGNPASNGYYTYIHGVDSMIDGWEEGIETIREGGTSLLIVPSKLAYGEYGSYAIPPYTTLLFTVYVHDIVPAE